MERIMAFKLWYCSHYSNVKHVLPVLHPDTFIKAWMSQFCTRFLWQWINEMSLIFMVSSTCTSWGLLTSLSVQQHHECTLCQLGKITDPVLMAKHVTMDMSNQFIMSSSFYKIMITTCSRKQPMKTMPCIICFPVPSLLVITYEVLDMACQSVLSDLNSVKDIY